MSTESTMRYADKIRKIIAKADSTTNPEEADLFMQKALAMMEEHGLNLLDLGRLDSDDPLGINRNQSFDMVKSGNSWARHVAFAAAEYYGCKAVSFDSYDRKRLSYVLAGRESARVTAELMIPYLIRQVRTMARVHAKRGLYDNDSRARTDIGKGLAGRLWSLAYRERSRRASATDGSNQLVLVDETQALLDERYGDIKSLKQKDGTALGRALAEDINLSRQTERDQSAKLLSN